MAVRMKSILTWKTLGLSLLASSFLFSSSMWETVSSKPFLTWNLAKSSYNWTCKMKKKFSWVRGTIWRAIFGNSPKKIHVGDPWNFHTAAWTFTSSRQLSNIVENYHTSTQWRTLKEEKKWNSKNWSESRPLWPVSISITMHYKELAHDSVLAALRGRCLLPFAFNLNTRLHRYRSISVDSKSFSKKIHQWNTNNKKETLFKSCHRDNTWRITKIRYLRLSDGGPV